MLPCGRGRGTAQAPPLPGKHAGPVLRPHAALAACLPVEPAVQGMWPGVCCSLSKLPLQKVSLRLRPVGRAVGGGGGSDPAPLLLSQPGCLSKAPFPLWMRWALIQPLVRSDLWSDPISDQVSGLIRSFVRSHPVVWLPLCGCRTSVCGSPLFRSCLLWSSFFYLHLLD